MLVSVDGEKTGGSWALKVLLLFTIGVTESSGSQEYVFIVYGGETIDKYGGRDCRVCFSEVKQ